MRKLRRCSAGVLIELYPDVNQITEIQDGMNLVGKLGCRTSKTLACTAIAVSRRRTAPERYRSNVAGKLIHDELQAIGAVGNLLAGVRGFEHSNLDVPDIRCFQPRR